MELEALSIPGCFLVRPRRLEDDRGYFVKTSPAPALEEAGLHTEWREELYTVSHRGVVRGMHFQTPPADQDKLLFCPSGEILDVVVDLRRGSPRYGGHLSVTLSGDNGCGLYVPTGCAHGFASMRDRSVVLYKLTGDFSAEHDGGIAWDSFGFDWPLDAPILSSRDRSHPTLDSFESPFVFKGART